MFSLDYRSRLPIYEQLYQSITRAAALGGIKPDEQLPSVRALAQELGVNPNTVQKAYQFLERDGIVYSVPGKGSFLSQNIKALTQRRLQALQKLKEAVKAALDCGVEKGEIMGCIETALQEGGKRDD